MSSFANRRNKLIAAIQECETEAHAVGMHETAHFLNAAKNKAGWELAGAPEKARETLKAAEYRR